MKRIPVLLFAIIFVISLVSCGITNTTITTSVTEPQVTTKADTTNAKVVKNEENKVNTTVKNSAVTQKNSNKSETKKNDVTAPAIDTAHNTDYTRTGVMAFSDSADNKYIKLVTDKYGVSSSLLAAIYTLPYEGMEQDADGNIVLQFDGSVDSSGKMIRTQDTLEMIYMIDADGVCTKASVDGSQQDDYNDVKRKLIVLFTTKYIMPKFESEL